MHMSSPIASQHILHRSQITFSIFCYLFLLASHVPLCHNLFCPLVPLPFSPQISLYSDKSGFLWGSCSVDSAAGLYNMFRQRKQRITDQCTKGAGQCVCVLQQMNTHCTTKSACGVSHYLPLSAQLLKTVSLTYLSIGKRSITYFPESRFPFLSQLGFLFL